MNPLLVRDLMTIDVFEATSVSTRPSPPLDDAPDLSGLITQDSPVNTNLHYFINPSGDEDWFRFYLSRTGNPQIHLTSLPANYDLYVYNAAGQLLGSSTKDKKAAEMVKLVNAIPGNYYIQIIGVDDARDSANPYKLRVNIPGAGKVYYITIKFHIHEEYLNSDYQFYVSKVEYCELWAGFDVVCNIRPGDDIVKLTANLIEGYLQPAP